MNWTTILLNSKGRIRRVAFWLGLLPVGALAGLIYLYARFVSGALPGWVNMLVMALVAVEALYFLAMLAAKRLRDVGRPQVFIAILYSPLLVAALFLLQQKFMPFLPPKPLVPFYTVAITMAITGFFWIMAEMMFRRSTDHDKDKDKDSSDNSKDKDEKDAGLPLTG